ncbi:MAG: porin family protein [Methylobacteriaceae bacterium]|nr:porin family protein [Methylobacteriaceae bacterium]
MKSPLLALAIASLAVPAVAADLPYRKGPPAPYVPPPPIFTWTGLYVGVNAGGIFDESSRGAETNPGILALAPAVPTSYRARDTGFLGGGQIGYNWQMGSIVAGLEADFQGTSLSSTSTVVAPSATGTFKKTLDWLGTARGRLGYTFTPQFLVYVTGGLAFGDTKLTHTLTDTTAGGVLFGGTTLSGTHSTTQTGWTLGGGGEYAFANNWSVKVEYLYFDLGRRSVTAISAAAPGVVSTVRENEKGSIIRAGLNYKFW